MVSRPIGPFWSMLVAQSYSPFLKLTEALARQLIAHDVDLLVTDALENEFLGHDVLHAVACTAVGMANQHRHTPIACYDYPLEDAPGSCPTELRDRAIWLRLDAKQLEQKFAAARSYGPVIHEVDAAVGTFGVESFAVECLRPVTDLAIDYRPATKPHYETHGEQLVAAGEYPEVVRFDRHVVPLLEELRAMSGVVLQKAA